MSKNRVSSEPCRLLLPSLVVAHASWVRLWEVHPLQAHGFCSLPPNPGTGGLCDPKADHEASCCCWWSALPSQGGAAAVPGPSEEISRALPSCAKPGSSSSPLRQPALPQGQPWHWRSDVSDSCWGHHEKRTPKQLMV